METRSGITVTQEDVEAFFSDITAGSKIYQRELTDFEKKITIAAYEKGYNKEETARKLGIGTKRMKRYYEEYKRDIK